MDELHYSYIPLLKGNIQKHRSPAKAYVAKLKANIYRKLTRKYCEAKYTVKTTLPDGTKIKIVFGQGWHILYAPGIISHADYFHTHDRGYSPYITKRKWWQIWKPKYYPAD